MKLRWELNANWKNRGVWLGFKYLRGPLWLSPPWRLAHILFSLSFFLTKRAHLLCPLAFISLFKKPGCVRACGCLSFRTCDHFQQTRSHDNNPWLGIICWKKKGKMHIKTFKRPRQMSWKVNGHINNQFGEHDVMFESCYQRLFIFSPYINGYQSWEKPDRVQLDQVAVGKNKESSKKTDTELAKVRRHGVAQFRHKIHHLAVFEV